LNHNQEIDQERKRTKFDTKLEKDSGKKNRKYI